MQLGQYLHLPSGISFHGAIGYIFEFSVAMSESLAFNCLFLSAQSLSSNEQGAISSQIIIYSSHACCLGIYTHDLLEI